MTIPYALLPNNLTTDPDDCFALVRPIKALSQEDILQRMLRRGTTIEEADIRGALQLFTSEIEAALMEGFSVRTDLVNFSSRILGVFTGRDDQFSADRHTIHARVNPGKSLRSVYRGQATATKQERIKPVPSPMILQDVSSGETNSVVTPGGQAVVLGHRLNFHQEDPEEGVFFVSEDGTSFQAPSVATNKPGRLVFLVPADLPAGSYQLEVHASPRGRSEIRTGILDETLYAASA